MILTDVEILGILNGLAKKRPVFHNEADFQFALAWEIQKTYSKCEIRLEYKVPSFENRYTDIWIKDENSIAIELKYKPKPVSIEFDNEFFKLKEHGAQDLGRYDFLKDVQRIEEIILKYPNVTGYAIILTNDHLYWDLPVKENSVDSDFKIHEGKIIHGSLSWSSLAGNGTTKNRTDSIIINGDYESNWSDYSIFDIPAFGKFRILCFEIGNINS